MIKQSVPFVSFVVQNLRPIQLDPEGNEPAALFDFV